MPSRALRAKSRGSKVRHPRGLLGCRAGAERRPADRIGRNALLCLAKWTVMQAWRVALWLLWLTTLGVACACRLDATLAGLLGFGTGTAIYFASLRANKALGGHRRLLEGTVALTGIFVASLGLTRVYYWVTWDPIGTVDDGWGVAPGFQDAVRDWPNMSIGHDLMTSIRRTSSGLLSVGFPASYFVFVHPPQEPDSRSNLVFRYAATEVGWGSPPEITWKDPNIVVAVPARDIFMVTRQRQSVRGVAMRYELHGSVHPAELLFWQRPFL